MLSGLQQLLSTMMDRKKASPDQRWEQGEVVLSQIHLQIRYQGPGKAKPVELTIGKNQTVPLSWVSLLVQQSSLP